MYKHMTKNNNPQNKAPRHTEKVFQDFSSHSFHFSICSYCINPCGRTTIKSSSHFSIVWTFSSTVSVCRSITTFKWYLVNNHKKLVTFINYEMSVLWSFFILKKKKENDFSLFTRNQYNPHEYLMSFEFTSYRASIESVNWLSTNMQCTFINKSSLKKFATMNGASTRKFFSQFLLLEKQFEGYFRGTIASFFSEQTNSVPFCSCGNGKVLCS